MRKVGIIRCAAYSDKCAGYKCFLAVRDKTGPMAEYVGEIDLVGFDTCGGCARKATGKLVDRAIRLRDHGAEVIHLGNCLVDACPWTEMFREAVEKETGRPVVLGTHP